MARKAKGDSTYIGEFLVKELQNNEDGTVTVSFKGHDDITISRNLFDLIIRPIKNEGSITDTIIHVLALKYTSDLTEMGLEFYMVENVTQSMRTLVHNLREAAIGRAFDCSGGLDMKLSKLID